MKEGGEALDAEVIAGLFTRDGQYLCARWSRPIAPVIFGLADETLPIFRDATRAVIADVRHPLVETDLEMGANMMSFFVRDWDELAQIPDLDRLTGQEGLADRLKDRDADQYRLFRFDADGTIRACMNFVNMGGKLAEAHPAQLAEALAVNSMLTFAHEVTPTPQLAKLIRAAYDPVMPSIARDPSHALRLAARLPH